MLNSSWSANRSQIVGISRNSPFNAAEDISRGRPMAVKRVSVKWMRSSWFPMDETTMIVTMRQMTLKRVTAEIIELICFEPRRQMVDRIHM